MNAERSETTYKVIVALAFGLIGFLTNFYPLDVVIPPNKASFVWGLVFPMLISLSWGWRYGLLSATIGLGAQTMWFLWLPKNGWAVFVAVPVYNGWILWHGWCAKNIRKGILSNIYGADIPYRIFFAIVFSTVFSWSFRFNPSPWAPQMTLTTAPPAFIYFIQFKVIFEGYIILLLADVLRNFRIVKRILLIEDRGGGKSDLILSGAMLFGLTYWIASSIAEQIYAIDNSTLADRLILNISPDRFTERLIIIIMSLVAGLILSNYFTKYRKAEAEMISQARKTQTYLETAGVMLCSMDTNGNVTMINPKGARILGYEQDEIIGKNWFDNYLPERLRGPVSNVFGQLMAGEGDPVAYYENAILAKGNIEKVLGFNNTILHDTDGNITGVLFSGEDITEKKRVERELQEANIIINRSPMVIFLWKNAEGWPVEFASENVPVLLGYSAREFMDGTVSYSSVIHPDDLQRVGNEVSSFSKKAGCDDFKHEPYRIIARDGRVKWVEDITHIRRDAEGAITHYQGIVFDVTDHLEADATIKRSLKEKEVLLKEVHHRVKNNMAVISAFLSLQSLYVEDKSYLDMLQESQNRIRAMALVHEQLYRTEDFAQIDLKAYVNSLVHNVENSSAMPNRVPMHVHVDDIHMDIDNLVPLGLIINELLSNSFRHAFTGREDPEIRLSINDAGNGNIVLEISDNGTGLPDGFVMDNNKGLGLQLVGLLTSQINGHLEVTSDRGTMFRITFPDQLEIARHLEKDG